MSTATQESPASGCWATKSDDPIGWCSGHGRYVDACPSTPVMVLSLLQPWATLWVTGAKRIETRSWGTSYRGWIAVHASKPFRQDEMRLCQEEPFASALVAAGVQKFRDIPTGAVLGAVNLVECLEMRDDELPFAAAGFDIRPKRDPRLANDERVFGAYSPGRFAWLTGQTRVVLPEPVPLRGALGLRVCPAEIARMVTP